MIKIVSFGYKHGMPPKDALVLDCRLLPHPHVVPEFREMDGRSGAVRS